MSATTLFGTVLTAAVLVTAAGCGGEGGTTRTESPPTAPPTSAGAPPTPTSAQRPAEFTSKIENVSRSMLRYSWRPGCPVPLSSLRRIEMTYWGFDKKPHTGHLVVNAGSAGDLVKVFRRLYEQRYPIQRMEPVDVYKGSDFDSIEANNTSAFNCRQATGSGNWSQHAYGLAVDINPCQNPYVTASGYVAHKHCVKYRNRNLDHPALIKPGDKVVRAFASIGWNWGGTWSGTKDYQHFSSSGR
ncbi:M15 family peptidase [Actinomadura craniellae]|uniref:M15 family peptidase n=1 Tax=Actinomadura craniellae TaxID=2231787 RepID=A0A365H654_9ACTN|nr:M15 family metallopeptidase [Actinomadura craniellae]RAY14571.1 M15 family peptidase [Actinomadura craniellae]